MAKIKRLSHRWKEHITKDFYVSRPEVFEEILDIMEELERREVSEIKKIQAEMDNKGWYNKHDREQFAKIINKHIAELKGE